LEGCRRNWRALRGTLREIFERSLKENLEDMKMADGTPVGGTWAYRYINTSDQPVFGAGLFTFQTPTATTLTGTNDMGVRIMVAFSG
jgi:hypothetical protein